MATVKIEPKPFGGTVELDGADISNVVSGLQLVQRAGYPPVVTLELSPACDVDVFVAEHAVVEVWRDKDPAEGTLAFLEPIDPEIFEADVLELTTTSDLSFGAAALEVVRRYARGD